MNYSVEKHLIEHAYDLEVAVYKRVNKAGPVSNVTVDCTKCGTVVVELYNRERPEETLAKYRKRWRRGP